MEYESVNYTINYWYDNRDKENPYEYVLGSSDVRTGYVGEVIEEIGDIKSDFYFRASDNLPLTLLPNESKNVINIYYTGAYRQYMYNMAKNSLTSNLVTPDLKAFLKLIGVIYGDLYTLSHNVDDAINIDYVDEEHLRHLCKINGYKWVEALTGDEQREGIKFYMQLRRMRGTSFGLKNLIRIFGQTTKSLYQTSSNLGVRVVEYEPNNKHKMFKGDIRIEIPELSNILREATNEVRLMGTRLLFAYRVDVEGTNEDVYGHVRGYFPSPSCVTNIKMWLQCGEKGWDTKIDLEEKENSNKLIYKYWNEFNIHGSVDMAVSQGEPFKEMFMFQEGGLTNIRGLLLDDGVIDENLYLYK